MSTQLKTGNISMDPGSQGIQFRMMQGIADPDPVNTKNFKQQMFRPNIATDQYISNMDEPTLYGLHNGRLPDNADSAEFYQTRMMYNGINIHFDTRTALINPAFHTENNGFSADAGNMEQLLNQESDPLPFSMDNMEAITFGALNERFESYKDPRSNRFALYYLHPELAQVEAKIYKNLKRGVSHTVKPMSYAEVKPARESHEHINIKNKYGYRAKEEMKNKHLHFFDVDKYYANEQAESKKIKAQPIIHVLSATGNTAIQAIGQAQSKTNTPTKNTPIKNIPINPASVYAITGSISSTHSTPNANSPVRIVVKNDSNNAVGPTTRSKNTGIPKRRGF